MKAKHVQTRMHPHSDNITKVKHHASSLVCHYLIERFVLGLHAAISITVTLKTKQKKEKHEYDGNENRLGDSRYAEAAPHSSGLLAEDGETLRARRLENNG